MDMELSILVATATDFSVAPPLPSGWLTRIAALVLVGLCANGKLSGAEAWLINTVALP